MHSGSSLTPENPAFSISTGIAALIIEGRPLYDEEYAIDSSADGIQRRRSGHNFPSSTLKYYRSQPESPPQNLLGSKYDFCAEKTPARAHSSCVGITDTPSGSSAFASKTDSTEHLERLRQKLHQLRSLPSTSYDFGEQSVAVSIESPPPPQTKTTASDAADLDQDELLDMIYERCSASSASVSTEKSKKPLELQFLASRSTSLQRTPRSLLHSEHNGLLQTVTSWTTNKFSPTKFSTPSSTSVSSMSSPSELMSSGSSAMLTPNLSYHDAKKLSDKRNGGKVLGPHCTQFLSKVGLLKGHSKVNPSAEIDEHQCFRSNEMCYRWQQCYKQIVPIFSRCEPICIEVYLGPEHHVILLEQWIIHQNQEPGRFSMTIQSLCTAIRSQLHFSQITAWSDVLKASSPNDPELKSNPRIKTTSKMPFKPKLDILYRIRPYSDATPSCFSAKPIVHNFPETMITDHLSIKVSLKSLPRMKCLPRLYMDVMDIACPASTESPATSPIIVDDRQEFDCHEKGKHRCPFDEESPTDDAISHRDKQLMKYKKRIMRRDKKKRSDELASQKSTADSSGNTCSSSSSKTVVAELNRNVKDRQKLSMTHFSPLDQPTINPNKPPLYSSMSVDESEPILCSNRNDTPTIDSTSMSTCTSNYVAINQTMHTQNMSAAAATSSTFTKSTQTTAIEMTSVGTQTDENQHYNVRSNQTSSNGQIIFHNCDFCGIEMQYFCWNCDKRMFMDTAESQDSVGKGDLLLKAIQRTPSVKQSQCMGAVSRTITSSSSSSTSNSCTINNNNNNHSINNNNINNTNNDEHINIPSPASTPPTPPHASNASLSNVISHSIKVCAAAVASDRNHCDSLINKDKNELDVDVSDCRSCCKRQKTVHNYDNNEQEQQQQQKPTAAYINSIRASCSSSSHSNNNNILPSRSSHLRDHTFSSVISNVTSYDDASAHLLAVKREHGDCSSGSYRRTMSESVVGTCHTDIEHSTPPGIDLINRCDAMINILSDNELKLYRRAYSEDELISCNCDDNRPKQLDLNTMNSSPPIGSIDFPTPNSSSSSSNNSNHVTAATAIIDDGDTTIDHIDLFKTPRSKQLSLESSSSSNNNNNNNQTKPIYIDCRNHRTDDDDCTQDSMPLNSSKSLPKINLTKLFTKTCDDPNVSNDYNVDCHELDINAELRKISQQATGGIPPMFSFDFENLSPPLISPTGGNGLVQKSNSAPSFQYSPPTLSPRFFKSAAAIKRRSRHLSDRSSERLSIGSDDHLSDEEFHQYCHDSEYRPGISPTKATLRFFPKNYAYRKRALLGSFEESLLQRRFEPKFLVPGYKVLLGASGCYCTNQITIPAYTFFYELNDESLSTPYVCEVSMPPRKGYVIPRTGHVQATLLNPNGMVVRMFVVAYDFRDMPAMCQTFVRQRILSFDENANPGRTVDDLSPTEQQKLLRYAIHLRFQTTRSGRLALHGDIRMLISRRTDCDTAAAHAKGAPESPSELKTVTIVPENPKFSPR